MAPLPKRVSFDVHGISAWTMVLQAEEAAQAKSSTGARYNDPLVGVRTLGYFLVHLWELPPTYAFARSAHARIIKEVFSCNSAAENDEVRNNMICKLGMDYVNFVLRAFRSNTGPLPTPSKHVSRPSFDVHKADMLAAMDKATKTKSEVKKVALGRDGYKCVLSGYYDADSYQKYPEVAEMRKRDSGAFLCTTEVAHLFSQTAQESDKKYAATALAFLEQFGLGASVHSFLIGGKVNSPSNVLTMDAELHTLFDRFEFWLEEVPGRPNTYDVVAPSGSFIFDRGIRPRRQITLSVAPELTAECEAKGVPVPGLPDRELMAMKAACARVAHLSGAAEQIDQLYRDVEDIQVLAEDGSHADCLISLLNHRIPVAAACT